MKLYRESTCFPMMGNSGYREQEDRRKCKNSYGFFMKKTEKEVLWCELYTIKMHNFQRNKMGIIDRKKMEKMPHISQKT